MRKRRILALLLCLLLLSACGGEMIPPPPEEPDIPQEAPPEPSGEPGEPEEPQPPEEAEDPRTAAEEAALKALLEDMTLAEKAGQLFFVRVPAENAVEDVIAYHLGGYILFGRDTKDKTAGGLIQTIRSYQEAAQSIPLLIGVDEEGGTVVRVSSNPHLRSKKFSAPGRLWRSGEEGRLALEAEAEERALLLKRLGFNVNLAPVADVSEDPSDFIYDRTTGGNAQDAALYASKMVVCQSLYGLGSVLKHFPGYGNNKDTHTGIAVDDRPMETFLERDFLPFQEVIGKKELLPRPAVLVSHNIVTCMDPDLPASLSPEVHRILREDLGFDGVVMTDDLAMDAVKAYAAEGNAAVLALQAGNDLVVTGDYRTQIPRVIQAVKDGTLEESVVDAACLRVLRWKLELGLLELAEDGTLERNFQIWN